MDPDLSAELYAHLASESREPGTRWVMNPEWWQEVRSLADANGHPLWQPSAVFSSPDLLLGKPFEIREDGGVPHLELRSGS